MVDLHSDTMPKLGRQCSTATRVTWTAVRYCPVALPPVSVSLRARRCALALELCVPPFARSRCRFTVSLYVMTLGPPTTVERAATRDTVSLFYSVSHWASGDKTAQRASVFSKPLTIFCSRWVLLPPADARSCSSWAGIIVSPSEVVGVGGTSLTGDLTDVPGAVNASGIVSTPPGRMSQLTKHAIGIEREQTYLARRRRDVLASKCRPSGAVIQEGEVLLADSVRPATKQLLRLFLVGHL